MRRDRRKDLYRRERDSLEGPHEEAEILRKALRRGKNLAFSKDTCLEKKAKWPDSKDATFVILMNHASAPIRKKRLSLTSKAMWEASRNKFAKKSEMPDRVESCRKVDSSENRPRTRPGFVKLIQHGV